MPESASFTVRPADPADAEALADLGARTFVDSFAAENHPGDVATYLAATYGPERQAAQLRDPDHAYFVAEADGALVGYALVRHPSPPPPCVTDADPVELAKLYVDRSWHGRGVAQALLAACVTEARTRGGRTLWLSVWERNPRGRAFYAKTGFRDVGTHPFVIGSDVQTDRILVLDLDRA